MQEKILSRENFGKQITCLIFWKNWRKENNVRKNHRDSFSHYYVPEVEIKVFNMLIDGKSFFDLPVKNEEEAYEKIIEMSRNNDYATVNLLDFAYFRKTAN